MHQIPSRACLVEVKHETSTLFITNLLKAAIVLMWPLVKMRSLNIYIKKIHHH